MKKSIFLFFAAILCAMTANAYNQAAKDLYFDNSEAKWEKCYVYIGKSDYTACYDMTRVNGTQYLWQLPANFNNGSSWNGASGWVVCKEKWWASSQETIDKYIWHGDNNVTKKSTSAWVDTHIYKTNGAANATSDGTTQKVYTVTSYTKSNYTVTISTVEGGTLTVKDYDDNAVATGASKIHLTVLKFSATPTDGYVLDAVEINDGTNTTTIAAADLATTTHTLTSAVTITPVWHATTSTVTVTATATNGTVTGGGVVEEGTSVTLTATPADGYKFVNWTVGGAEVSTANPYTFTAEEDVTVVANFEETPKATIYFVNNSGWSKIQAYAWEGTKGANPGWPGADITANKLGEQIGGFDVYSYTVEQGSYGKVIFNNGSAQTADYVWTDGNYYWHNEAANFAGGTKAQAEEKFSVPVEYDYVYLINTNDWAKAYIYTWTPEVAGWPGAEMTKEDYQIAGKDVYSYKEVKGSTFGGMLFNNGDGTQTGDLTWQAGKYYAPSTGEWYADAATAEAALAAVVTYDYYVVGTINGWGLKDASYGMELSGDVYEKEVAFVIGKHELKINNGAWDNANTFGYDNLSVAYEGVSRGSGDGDNNIVIDLAEAKTITIKLDKNTKKITLEGLTQIHTVKATVNPAETGTIEGAGTYVQGATATLTATAAEGYEFVNWTKGEEVVSTANPYTFDVTENVTLVANFVAVDYKDITFTVGKSGFTGVPQIKWWGAKGLEDAAEPVEMTAGQQYGRYSYTFSNIDAITGVSFYIVLDGVQSKTITLHETPNSYSQFYTILQEVFVTLEGETEGVQLEGHPKAGYSSDYTKVNGVVQLPANTTKAFKLTVDGKDKGGNTIALTKDNLTANFTEDGEGNATIATELAGGYLFTYDYITKDVTVVYPFVGTMDLGQMTPSYSDESVKLEDDNYNEVTIYNVVEGEHTFGDNFDIEASVKHNGEWYTLTGKGSWTLADGVMTLVATNLVDENNTVNYTITATALAPQEYTIACNGTYDEEVSAYYSSIKYAATTDEEDVIVIEIGVYGEETSASGQFNDTWFTTLTYTVAEGEDGVKVLTATATDEAGNTYHITITATKLVYPSINIYNAKLVADEDGDVILTCTYEGVNLTLNYYYAMWTGEYTAELASEDYSVYYSCEAPSLEKDGSNYTITGVFVDDSDETKYNVMVTTKANPATALDNLNTTVAPVKAIENGQLIVIKNGVKYNAQGAILK